MNHRHCRRSLCLPLNNWLWASYAGTWVRLSPVLGQYQRARGLRYPPGPPECFVTTVLVCLVPPNVVQTFLDPAPAATCLALTLESYFHWGVGIPRAERKLLALSHSYAVRSRLCCGMRTEHITVYVFLSIFCSCRAWPASWPD
jgi:hypothetical protein